MGSGKILEKSVLLASKMSDNEDGPLFDEVETSAPKKEDSELIDDTKKVSLDDQSEEQEVDKKPDTEHEQGLPASIPVSIDSDPNEDSAKVKPVF